MMHLQIVIVSTREQRQGPAVARWFHTQAERHAGFDLELVDLADVNLPLLDEPHHPRLANYMHEHTKRWSAIVSRADAFVFVTPEYNYGSPPSLVNALDYLLREWAYKPVGFVSYGGISGGTRSVQMTKQIVTSLRMMPMVEAVTHPDVHAVHRPPHARVHADRGAGEGRRGHARRAGAMGGGAEAVACRRRLEMKDTLLGGIAIACGGLILTAGIFNVLGGRVQSGAFAAGQAVALGFAVFMLYAGIRALWMPRDQGAPDRFVRFKSGDRQMDAAIEAARQDFGDFVRVFREPGEQQHTFQLKVAFCRR